MQLIQKQYNRINKAQALDAPAKAVERNRGPQQFLDLPGAKLQLILTIIDVS